MAHILDLPGIQPGWMRGYPPVTTQSDGTISLRDYAIRGHGDQVHRFFYPLRLLRHLFTKEVLCREIEAAGVVPPTKQTDLANKILGSGLSNPQTYIQVFAILKDLNRLRYLQDFIQNGVSDQDLPLDSDYCNGDTPLFRKGTKGPPLRINMDSDGKSLFLDRQHAMVVPFFDRRNEIYKLGSTQVLPYYKLKDREASTEWDHNSGGFASVSKILLHPLCHAYNDPPRQGLDEITWFALKELHSSDLESFKREVEMLLRFNGKLHPHLVTLLASFSRDSKYFLIFPWATCDLGRYWEMIRPEPESGDTELIRWICHQAWMLVDAVKCIHNVSKDETQEHGRHGDIKPENILWYKSDSGLGKLVISDMGLSKAHRFHSKTYTLKGKAQATPKYRPPELDYEGGKMSVKFDIWCLGCVFLEMANWLLGGFKLFEDMEEARAAPSVRMNGAHGYEFYEWVYVEDLDDNAVRVKKAVTNNIDILRRRSECSQFVYDLLDIVEDDMLVVNRNARISAADLEKKMKDLSANCEETEYCTKRHQNERRDARKPKLCVGKFNADKIRNAGGVMRDNLPKVFSSDSSGGEATST